MKKVLSVLLALCLLLLPLSVYAAATETDAVLSGTDAQASADGEEAVPETLVLDSVADVATFILEPLTWCEIQIVPAVLTTAEGEQDVYFVALRGAGLQMNKANNAIVAAKATIASKKAEG